MADNNLQRWISRLKNNPWPAHLPQIEVEKNASSIDSLVKCLSRDPLLASWVFKHAGHMFYQASNLRDAVTFLGIPKTLEACRHVPRIDVTAHKYNGLMQAVGDSLLAAELMQRWFNQRNFKWQDKDYWTVLYDSVIIWAMWWTEPTLMEGFDFRRINGDRLHTLICDYLDCRYLQILEAVNKEWHLPISFNLREQAKNETDLNWSRKAHSLIFFLPFSYEVAQTSRLSWESQGFLEMTKKGRQSLNDVEFVANLKHLLIDIAQHNSFPWIAASARRMFSHQPALYLTDWRSAEKNTDKQKNTDMLFRGIIKNMLSQPSTYFDEEDLCHAYANACIKGLGLSRCMVWIYDSTHRQFVYVYGEDHTELYFPSTDRFDIGTSNIMRQVISRPTSALVNDENITKILQDLPKDLTTVLSTQSFMLKSIVLGSKGNYLLLADAPEISAPSYAKFRELGMAFNQCLKNFIGF